MVFVFIAYSYCEPVIGMHGKNSIFLISTSRGITRKITKIYEIKAFSEEPEVFLVIMSLKSHNCFSTNNSISILDISVI